MTDQEQYREMWRRHYELPVKIHTSMGRFVWSRGRSVYSANTLEQAMIRAYDVLACQGVKPFAYFGRPSVQ